MSETSGFGRRRPYPDPMQLVCSYLAVRPFDGRERRRPSRRSPYMASDIRTRTPTGHPRHTPPASFHTTTSGIRRGADGIIPRPRSQIRIDHASSIHPRFYPEKAGRNYFPSMYVDTVVVGYSNSC